MINSLGQHIGLSLRREQVFSRIKPDRTIAVTRVGVAETCRFQKIVDTECKEGIVAKS